MGLARARARVFMHFPLPASAMQRMHVFVSSSIEHARADTERDEERHRDLAQDG